MTSDSQGIENDLSEASIELVHWELLAVEAIDAIGFDNHLLVSECGSSKGQIVQVAAILCRDEAPVVRVADPTGLGIVVDQPLLQMGHVISQIDPLVDSDEVLEGVSDLLNAVFLSHITVSEHANSVSIVENSLHLEVHEAHSALAVLVEDL